jgi:hypothetical protein
MLGNTRAIRFGLRLDPSGYTSCTYHHGEPSCWQPDTPCAGPKTDRLAVETADFRHENSSSYVFKIDTHCRRNCIGRPSDCEPFGRCRQEEGRETHSAHNNSKANDSKANNSKADDPEHSRSNHCTSSADNNGGTSNDARNPNDTSCAEDTQVSRALFHPSQQRSKQCLPRRRQSRI